MSNTHSKKINISLIKTLLNQRGSKSWNEANDFKEHIKQHY